MLSTSCKRNLAASRVLIEHGANVEVRNDRGQTPLHVASQLDFLDIMQILLKHDANPDAQDHNNTTPLHVASYKRNFAATQVLFEREHKYAETEGPDAATPSVKTRLPCADGDITDAR
jgi:ankyrin repeat protein